MKKLVFLLFALFVFSLSEESVVSHAESSTYYAKVLGENYFFYSEPNENESSKLFILPSSFFVLLLSSANENFYYAKYQDLYGYVKKTEVTPMDGTPTSPYPNEKFRVFSLNGLKVHDKAFSTSVSTGKIDYLQENITLYGFMPGEEYVPNSTNIWYYCKLEQNQNVLQGYVFSYYCDIFESFSENTEYFPEITGSLIFDSEVPANGGLSDTVKAIIILGVSLPCLIVLYLLLSPTKRHLKKQSGKRTALKGGKDYYEFNEDDL